MKKIIDSLPNEGFVSLLIKDKNNLDNEQIKSIVNKTILEVYSNFNKEKNNENLHSSAPEK